MKLNRRNFFGLLGMGASAAVLPCAPTIPAPVKVPRELARSFDKATFNIGINRLSVGINVAPHYFIRNSGRLKELIVRILEPPVGSAVVAEFNYTPPGLSVFASARPLLNFPIILRPEGITSYSAFVEPLRLEEGGILTCDVLGVGSIYPGRCLVCVVKWELDHPA